MLAGGGGGIKRVWVLRKQTCKVRDDQMKTLRYSVDVAPSSLTINRWKTSKREVPYIEG